MRRLGASERQALRMVSNSASFFRYRSTARDAGGLRLRIKEITDTRVHYGYRPVHVVLRREGYQDNVKRVYRLDVGQSLKGEDVVMSLQRICEERGFPRSIKTDNGSVFISKAMYKSAHERGVALDFSRPGKPTDNARVESFSGRPASGVLERPLVSVLGRCQGQNQRMEGDHNESRPQSSRQRDTLVEFARRSLREPETTIPEKPEISVPERY